MTHVLQLASFLRDHVWAMHRPALQAVVAQLVAMAAAPAQSTPLSRTLGVAGAASDQGAAPSPTLVHQAAAPDGPVMADSGVAVIAIHGLITYRSSVWSEWFGGCTVLRIQRLLRSALADPAVKAIVLDIDSPGGTVNGVDELAAEIRAARAIKPIVAVANTFAASAAYWLGSAAESVVGLPTSQVGSIGVYTIHEDISRWLDSLGVTVTVIAAGEHKAETLPYAALSEDARAHLQAGVDAAYGLFVTAVADGRQVAVDVVRGESFGQGRVYDAKEAKKRGLIDRVGTYDSVVSKLLTARRPGATTRAEADPDEAERVSDGTTLQTVTPAAAPAVAAEPAAPPVAAVADDTDIDVRHRRLRWQEV